MRPVPDRSDASGPAGYRHPLCFATPARSIIEDEGRAIPVFEVSVREPDRGEVVTMRDGDGDVIECAGKAGHEIDGVALVDDLHLHRPAQGDGIMLVRIADGPGRVDIVVDVYRLLDVREAFVVAARRVGDEGQELFERRGVAVVSGSAVRHNLRRTLGRPVGEGGIARKEDVADVAIIAAVHGRVTGDLRTVRKVVGRGALNDRLDRHGPADKVVDERPTLAEYFQRCGGGEDVVLHQVRPVADFDEQVAGVRVEEIATEPSSLGLPVEPDGQRAVVDPVVSDVDVDRRMEFDSGDLVPVELAFDPDVVDVVVLDGGEHTAEVADNAILTAVEDRVATDDVRADVFLVPSDLAGGEHRLELVLVAGFVAPDGGVVVAGRGFLAEGDRGALRIVDGVVLDDPALRPVRPDQAGLVGGRRRPGAGRLRELKPANGDVVDVVLGGVEHGAPDVDLDEFNIGVCVLKVGPDGGAVGADLGEPDESGLLGIADVVSGSGPIVDRFSSQYGIRRRSRGWMLRKS